MNSSDMDTDHEGIEGCECRINTPVFRAACDEFLHSRNLPTRARPMGMDRLPFGEAEEKKPPVADMNENRVIIHQSKPAQVLRKWVRKVQDITPPPSLKPDWPAVVRAGIKAGYVKRSPREDQP